MDDEDYYTDKTKTIISDLSPEQLEELKKHGKTKKPLDYKLKLNIMIKKGKRDVEALKNMDLGMHHKLDLSDPGKRKVYAIKRSLLNKSIGGAPDQEFRIGDQWLRVSNGTGNFIGDGTNKPEREKVTEVTKHTIQHPLGDYKNLITKMQGMGSDPAVVELYRLAKNDGNELKEKGKLSDNELATLMLFYLDENVSDKYKGRTSLTEHLQKFAAIASIAEETRSYEAINDEREATPYSALEIIKHDLRNVSKSIYTLDEVFYKGTNGKGSRFPGAPTDGGADALRYPFSSKHQEKWEEQMRDFSGNKKEFKSELNSVVSNSRLSLPELSAEQIEEQNKKREKFLNDMKSKEGKQNVEDLLELIEELTPEKLNYDQKSLENYKNVYLNKLKRWESEYLSFSEVVSEIKKAEEELRSMVDGFKKTMENAISNKGKRPRNIFHKPYSK
ncbi:hypothetical protein ACFVS2_33880 [Brevibacillus sp. NPDC058079]|uniref:hypothetical protein n=1 Tax=Brevibacillus sp. NPDC058079 TaxID=3346330 RepID=UPI0036E256FC